MRCPRGWHRTRQALKSSDGVARHPIWVRPSAQELAMTARSPTDGSRCCSCREGHEVWGVARRARPSGPGPRALQITVGGMVAIGEGDEVTNCGTWPADVALYIGGMGAKGRTSTTTSCGYGYEEERRRSGPLPRRQEAEAEDWCRRAARVDALCVRPLRGRAVGVQGGRCQPPPGHAGAHRRSDPAGHHRPGER